MKHVLDNPAWSALISGNKHLANGTDIVKYFAPEVSPFVALQENTQQNLALLHPSIPFGNSIAIIADETMPIPEPWTVLQRVDGFQMIYDCLAEQPSDNPKISPLTTEHIPHMLALTRLTRPGPFSSRTIEFGHYEGIFDGKHLVAMTGQRLHAFEFAEVSAVCTHPNYLGKGYARQLIVNQLHRIQQASGTPYLHVRSDNDRAIRIYKGMGFDIRKEIYFYFLKRQ